MQHPPVKDRRNTGSVVPFVEKFLAARELSSCCVGTEAALEVDRPDLVRLAKSLQDSF
jgi:hypothetical protein